MLQLLKNLWSAPPADADDLELLRYRSNLLGADLRITNFGGGNTSSKIASDGRQMLAVKGSGGDLGSIRREGFALLDMGRLQALREEYRGEAHEDEMAARYAGCACGASKAPASIDTPLHAFLPFPHVDHLHPDWAIAIAASANGQQRLAEFNQRFGHNVIWIRWQRPGFELGLMMERAVAENPGCDGILLANHGLFTWGETHHEAYQNSIRMIDDMGQFVTGFESHAVPFGGLRGDLGSAVTPAELFPELRRRMAPAIGHFSNAPDVMAFVNSRDARRLAALGTSCPDHFIRTRVRPMFAEVDGIDQALEQYRADYAAYYQRNREPDSPPMRNANPTVVLIPGVGMFTFARNKKEARITSEFYTNAIHVISGALALGGPGNYVALPEREAFRIEYWSLEEAKLRRMPPEGPLARRVFFLVSQNGADAALCDGTRQTLESAGALIAAGSPTPDAVLEAGGYDGTITLP